MTLNFWPLSAADSVTFQILPYGPQQDIVQIYCSRGSHEGKYLLVNSNNEVIAGATTDGDSVFLRQNVGSLRSSLLTITLTPINVPMHYISFHAESGKAQLETELTDRSRLQLLNTEIRPPVARDDLEAMENLLTGVESQEMTEDN